MTAAIASDFSPVRTADGSFTLRSGTLDEQYHSLHGAARESRHVFIEAGLRPISKASVVLLEVGLGTGLNALLTWIEAEAEGIPVDYHALEPYPLPVDRLLAVDHPGHLGELRRAGGFLAMMTAPAGTRVDLGPHFTFRRSEARVQELDQRDAYDLVYFDAFAPEKQADMWTEDVFGRLFHATRPGGALVTYCAKGAVRRTMERAGFTVERLAGPPGKREMLRARRPS